MSRPNIDERIDAMLSHGGLGFWVSCIISCLGFYGLLWFSLALGTILGL